ncbi:DUF4179 domain-containing protein [Priestia aryabhattai]|uniref:DUF4179 domain-containing protein n=1 Tax=Priestia TaxID=2800373 RepID=UPI001C8E0765|nr:DUF4179 domain-containing protein [Priestia aryabhattai]MBY0004034.1 DUF4179 domain-containing protein [Priestia aryabhattai]MBY0046681.1 DUF4179 domain-containing protein [Priestia aryabhattai]MDE8672806.1 DUF4179 domain-containing protein [Priestia aryabhattai]
MKNQYDLLNGSSIDVDEYEEIELTEREKKRMKKRLKREIKPVRKKVRPLIAAAVLLLAVTPVMMKNETVWASAVRISQQLGQQIELLMNKPEGSLSSYKKAVNETATDQGIQVKVNEMMLDDGQVLLGLTISADEFRRTALGLNRNTPIRPGELRVKIGNMSFFDSASSIREEPIKNKDGSWDYLYTLKLTQADTNGDGKIDVKGYSVLDHIDPNKNYQISAQFTSLEFEKNPGQTKSGNYRDSYGEIKGNWTVHTSVNGSKIIADTKVYPLNKEIPISEKGIEGVLSIKEVRVSPVSIKMHYTFTSSNGSIRGGTDIGVKIKDQNGRDLSESGSGGGTDTVLERDDEYRNDKGVVMLRFVPYVSDYENDSSKDLTSDAFNLKVNNN